MSNRRRGSDRGEFLEKLVQEYKDTKSLEAKQQVLANLANFAYNPFNFKWLWDLDVVSLFLDAITEQDPQLKEFGTAGLANICLDPWHRDYLVSEDYHIRSLVSCIPDAPLHTADTQMNAMTTLMYLADDATSIVLNENLKQALIRLQSSGSNKTVRTMASLFLNDYFQDRET